MSEKAKKMKKADDAPAPVEAIAVRIMNELDRVHVRTSKF